MLGCRKNTPTFLFYILKYHIHESSPPIVSIKKGGIVHMKNQLYCINDLINLKGVFIKKIINNENSVHIYIETKAKEHICPCCGTITSRVHDYRTQKIKDIPIHFKDCFLFLRKRRYSCPNCNKRFMEHYDFLARYQQRTVRLSFLIVNLLRNNVSVKHISEETNVSCSTIFRLLDTLNYCIKPLGDTIAIDEFKGNASNNKYQCILVNPDKHCILDILPDRTNSHLSSYFTDIKRSERYKVKYFICDMWQPYVDIAKNYFPNAKIIIDKYHFRRQLTWAIDRIRKRLQKTMPTNLRKYYKRSKTIIHKPYNSLSKEDKERCDLMLLYNDDLRTSHQLKEWFDSFKHEKKYSVIRKSFHDWIKNAESCGIPELEDVAATYRRWAKGILNAYKYNLSNGVTEGFNNKIKVLKRTSYGIRNFKHLRTRILHLSN